MFYPLFTLVCFIAVAGTSVFAIVKGPATRPLPDAPEAVASFGAAVVDDEVYVYGGHIGRAHQHSRDNLSSGFYKFKLPDGAKWSKVGEVRPLQGLALVAHGGKVYRIGGLDARNPKEKPSELWSTDEVTCFDPATGKWTTLTPLPEPRSSHDAVVVGDTVYVAGGWKLAGDDIDAEWHTVVHTADLSKRPLEWKRAPELPFRIRANALAAIEGKVVLIGGIKPTGKTSNGVAVLELKTGKWTDGPDFPGDERMRAFGASAFGVGDRVYASAWDGQVYALGGDLTQWRALAPGMLAEPRFFHRLVPFKDQALLFIGGASTKGHLASVEWLDLKEQEKAAE